MSEKEEILLLKTSSILKKDTSMMKLNDIIEELVNIIETNLEADQSYCQCRVMIIYLNILITY